MLYRCFPAAFLLFLPLHSLAQDQQEEAPAALVVSDFDGDGISDVIKIEDEADGSANTLIRHQLLSFDAITDSDQFGKTGDIIADSKYLDGYDTLLAIVREDEENNVLSWRIKVPGDENILTDFGVPDDYVFAGCDFTGDGLADRAVITTAGVLRVLDSSDSETVTETTLELPSGFLLHNGTCHGSGDDILLLFIASQSDPQSQALADVTAQKCAIWKANKKRSSDVSPLKRKRSRRKWRNNRDLCKQLLSDDGESGQGSSGETKTLYVLDGEGVEQSSHVLGQNSSLALLFDYDNDGNLDPAVLRLKNKTTIIDTFLPNGNGGFTTANIDLGVKITDATLITVTDENDEPIDALHLLDSNGTVHRLGIDTSTLEPLTTDLGGTALLHGVNLAATGTTTPSDPSGMCGGDIKDFGDQAGVGNLLKIPDHLPARSVFLISRQYGWTAQTLSVYKNGDVFATTYNTGSANGDQYGGRVHFRNNEYAPQEYSGGLVVIKDTRNNSHCFSLPESIGTRVD
ncbi:MAG: hypothetical protein KDD55_04420 [Bdellovibrionales bacterium]|nr:hypothetical protein [Bdellovibrionales bacterium]